MQKRTELFKEPRTRARRGRAVVERDKTAPRIGRPAPGRFLLGRFFGLACLLIGPPLHGGIIADVGAPEDHRPEVLTMANGLPVVNIRPPNGNGISYNHYQQFDVAAPGVILNNATTVSQTELAGGVAANPLLTREATLIINEVTQPHPSRLNGYIEVAGQPADVILANPAGISCNGCGFINARVSTLTTGRPISEEGQLKGYQVDDGQIEVTGRGMNTTNTDYTQLIARAVAVNAQLHGSSLTLVTGRNRVDTRGGVTGIFAEVGSEQPPYALDVAALGGMYAQKIVMLGTEKGVGVRNAGEMGAGVGELSISVAGRLENRGSMQSQDTLALATQGDVVNAGRLATQSNAIFSATGTIYNGGAVRAGGNVTFTARRIDNTCDSLLVAGSDAQGQLTQPGNLIMTSQGPLIAQGTHQACGAVMMWGTEVDLAGSRIAGDNIVLSASQGVISSNNAHINGGKITARAATSLTNNNGRLTADALTLTAQDISNRLGTLQQRGEQLLQVKTHRLNNQQGLLINSGDTTVQTDWLENRAGRIIVNGHNLSLQTKTLDNQDGSIKLMGTGKMSLTAERLNGYQGILWSGGAMTLQGEWVDLSQSVTRAQSLSLTATRLRHQKGIMWQPDAGEMKVFVSGEADNRGGWIESGGVLWLLSGYLNNAVGTLIAADDGSLILQAERGINNAYGYLQGSRNLTIKANKLDNQGGRLLALGGEAQLETQLVLINTGGRIEAKNRLTQRSQHLMNANGILAGEEVMIDTRRKPLGNTGGSVLAQAAMQISCGLLENNGGRLQAGGNLRIDTRGQPLQNRYTGNTGIQCGADLFLDAGEVDNMAGMISAAGATQIDGGALKNSEGKLTTAQSMKLMTRSLENQGGSLQAGTLLSITTGALDNSAGRIVTAGEARIKSREFNNSGGCLQAGSDLNIDTEGQRLSNTHSSHAGILCGGRLTLTAGDIDNEAGLISAVGECRVNSGALLNAGGRLQSGDHLQLDTHGQQLNNAYSRNAGILSGGNLLIYAGEITNTAGRITATAEGRIQSRAIDNAGGQLQANNDLHIDTQGQRLSNIHSVNTGILSGGNLWLNSGEIDNTSGIMAAAGQTCVSSAALTNTDGRFISDPTLVLPTSSLANLGGRLGGATLGIIIDADRPPILTRHHGDAPQEEGDHPPQRSQTPQTRPDAATANEAAKSARGVGG